MIRLPSAGWILAVMLAASVPAGAAKLLGDPESVRRHAEVSSGMLLTGGGMVLHAAVGESAVGSATGGSFQMDRGLLNVDAQPGSVVAITAVSKSTGTLDLSWLAPGLDGFAGSVAAGFYRIDYSSDALHAFAPTTYQIEFATTVSAGATQSYQLQGLSPNTTYYTRIYLADVRKYFADDSRRSDESTLANVPIDPIVVDVSSKQVTIAWAVPAGDCEGYRTEASSTSYGSILPGGTVFSSATVDWRVVSLTVVGLNPDTTYYFRVGSLNWQQDRNYSVIFPVLTTLTATPLPVVRIIGTQNALARSIALSWTRIRQNFPPPIGVLVLLSTNPVTGQVSDGQSFSPAQVLGDGSVVKATDTSNSLVDIGLVLDTTYYYHLFAAGEGPQGPAYSIAVTTAVFLDLPPMAPAGLAGQPSIDRTKVTLSWQPTSSNLDGSLFASTTTPRDVEFAQYEIARSTALFGANFVKIATVSAAGLTFTDTLPNPYITYLYRVRALDSFVTSDRAMAVDSNGDLYIFADDQITHLRIPRSLTAEMASAQVLLKAQEQPVDGTNGVFRSVNFHGLRAPLGTPVDRFQFSAPGVEVALHYQAAHGNVVPSGLTPQANYAKIPLDQASQNLGLYWDDGSKFVKMFGAVDPGRQLVSMKTRLAGTYQIRSLLREQGFSFDLSTLSNRIITPNGDGLNDIAVFRFDNPRDSAFSGRIFDTTGGAVATMTPGPMPKSLQWDGKANGQPVSGGVYVYQIQGEGKTFTGTLLVIQ